MSDVWTVMLVANGKTDAIAHAAGPEAPGAVLRVEEKNYEVVFSQAEGTRGWIYVTDLILPRKG